MTIQTLFLFLIAFLVGSDEFLLGPILTPIGDDLGVEPEKVALFIGAYALPLACLAPFLGGLSDRFGRRRVLIPAIVVFSFGSLATGLTSVYWGALASRVITGIGAAGMLPVAFALAADSGPKQMAKNIAAVQAGLTGGIIIAPAYGAWVTTVFGWKMAFVSLAGLGIVTAFGGVMFMSGAANGEKLSTKSGRLFVPGALGAVVAMGFGLGGAIGIYALAGERLRQIAGIGTTEVGLIYAGFGIVTLLGNLAMPSAIRHLNDGRRVMRLCLTGVLGGIILLYAVPVPLAAACIAMAVWAFLGGLGAPGLQMHLAALSPDRRGTLMALGSSAMNLGVALWSAVAGLGFSASSTLVALQAFLTVGIAILALRPINSAVSEPDLH